MASKAGTGFRDIYFLVSYIIATAVTSYYEYAENMCLVRVFKPIGMFLLTLQVYLRFRINRPLRVTFIQVAFICALAGDIMLTFTTEILF